MKKLIAFLIILIPIYVIGQTTYYFDSEDGDDGNSGTSSGAPKQSLSEMQTIANSLTAGDKILLKYGSVWTEATLQVLNRNGTSINPIAIDAYGDPNDGKPELRGLEDVSGGFSQTGYSFSQTLSYDVSRDYYKQVETEYSSRNYWNYQNFLIINDVNYAIGSYPDQGDGYLDVDNMSADQRSWLEDNDVTFDVNQFQGGQFNTVPAVNSTPYQWIFQRVGVASNDIHRINLIYNEWDVFNFHQLANPNVYGEAKYFMSNIPGVNTTTGEWSFNTSTRLLNVYYEGDLNSQTVEFAIHDYTLDIDGCSYVHVKNIKLTGGIIANVRGIRSDHLTVSNNDFEFMPYCGAYFYQTDSITFTYNDLREGCNDGFFTWECSDIQNSRNIFVDIGIWQTMGGDRDETNFSAVIDYRRKGDFIFTENYIKGTGLNGCMGSTMYTGYYGDWIWNQNRIFDYGQLLTDAAGVYLFQDQVTGGGLIRQVKYNIIKSLYSNNEVQYYGPDRDDINTRAIYMDGWMAEVDIDSNNVYGNAHAFVFHESEDCNVRWNNAYAPGAMPDAKDPCAWRGYTAHYGHNGGTTTNLNFKHNIIVDTNGYYLGFWMYDDPFDGGGSDADTNYYWTNGGSFGRMGGDYQAEALSFSSWKSITGFDAHSTLNSPAYDVSGDNDVILLSNMSFDSVRTVQLYDITFFDYLGNTVEDSVQLQPGQGMMLFRETGSGLDANMALIEPIAWGSVSSPPESGDTCDYYITVYDTLSMLDSAIFYFENNLDDSYDDLTLTYTGTPDYDAVSAVCQGSYSIDPDPAYELYTESIELGDTFRTSFCYQYYGSNAGVLISNRTSTTSGWQLYRNSSMGLVFMTRNSSDEIENVTTADNVVSGTSLYEIELIVNRSAGWVSIIVDDEYVTPADSVILTDFNTDGQIWLASDASGSNNANSYFDNWYLRWGGLEVIETDSCVIADTLFIADTISSWENNVASCSPFDCSYQWNALCNDTTYTLFSGDYLLFRHVYFGTAGANTVRLKFQMPTPGEQFEIRLDGPSGTLLKTITSTHSNPATCHEQFVTIPFTQGMQNICIKNISSAETLDFAWMHFAFVSSETYWKYRPLRIDEDTVGFVKLNGKYYMLPE